MNKKGFIENWPAFMILTGVGIAMFFIMMKIWSAQDFEMNLFTKIAIIIICPIAAGFFTKLWFE